MKNSKKKIRQEILQARRDMYAINVKQKSELIEKKLLDLELYKKAKSIFIYIDHDNEVITRNVINHSFKVSKKVVVPKVLSKGNMAFYQINSLENLELSSVNIYEPTGTNCEIEPDEHSLMIIPGVVFDGNGNRIGYGGGYYDKYLNNHPCNSLAICYDYQILEHIPTEDFDKKIHMIITESRIITT